MKLVIPGKRHRYVRAHFIVIEKKGKDPARDCTAAAPEEEVVTTPENVDGTG